MYRLNDVTQEAVTSKVKWNEFGLRWHHVTTVHVFQGTVDSKLVDLKKMERWVKKLEDQVNLLRLGRRGLQMC